MERSSEGEHCWASPRTRALVQITSLLDDFLDELNEQVEPLDVENLFRVPGDGSKLGGAGFSNGNGTDRAAQCQERGGYERGCKPNVGKAITQNNDFVCVIRLEEELRCGIAQRGRQVGSTTSLFTVTHSAEEQRAVAGERTDCGGERGVLHSAEAYLAVSGDDISNEIDKVELGLKVFRGDGAASVYGETHIYVTAVLLNAGADRAKSV